MAATGRPAQAANAKVLVAVLDRLPVAFALFDAGRRLAAWNAPLASLGLFPKALLRKGAPLAEFLRRDAGLKRRAASPHEVKLPAGRVLKVTRRRVPPGHLLLTYEDVTEARSARDDAAEAHERQTATAEILKAISGSTDLKSVFATILENALRLCGAHLGILNLREGDLFRGVVQRGGSPEFEEWIVERGAFKPEYVLGRMLAERQPIHIPDMREIPSYRERKPVTVRMVELGGARTFLVVPLLKNREVIGNVAIYRPEVRPFTEKQIALVSTFAAQAVIAIENGRLFNATKEALERQTATAEILKVIAGSPTDVQPVFDVIVQSAVRLCGARFGRAYRYDGSVIQMVASHGLSAKGLGKVRQVFPRAASDDTIVGRVILTRLPFFVKDIEREESVPALSRQMIEALGTRSQVTVPMLRAGEPIGVITIGWDAPAAFDDQQVALLQTFADQAVIAIENVRLFNETKEALEQQTASNEILGVISSSPTDLAPVFDAILDGATRLCDAHLGVLNLYDGEHTRTVAQRGGNPEFAKWVFERGAYKPGGILARTIAERRPIQFADVKESPGYREGYVHAVNLAELGGARSFLMVPLVKDDRVMGGIAIYRPEVRPFTEKQIELVKTFANQAVIAIENVRLFNETKEGLERQTATAEILKVIASSPSDMQPVFDAIVKSALRLIGGFSAVVHRVVGDMQHLAAFTTTNPDGDEALKSLFPAPISAQTNAGRAILSRAPSYRIDVETDPEISPAGREMARARGYRSLVAVPMMREGVAIGAISVTRREPGSFSNHQIDLLQTFADQAVIAIENVRLFNETKEALERQTATAEILKVIASSPSDVQPVFDVIVNSAQRLLGGRAATMTRIVDGMLHLAAFTAEDQAGIEAGIEALKTFYPVPATRGVAGEVLRTLAPVNVADTETDPGIHSSTRDMARARGFRSLVIAPLVRNGAAIGMIHVTRAQPGQFSGHHLDLLKTFADQAVIAIENVRLFNDTKEALDRQTATAEILKVISASPTDVQPVFGAIAERAAALCGAEFGFVARYDGDLIHHGASVGPSPEALELHRAGYPMNPGTGSVTARVVLQGVPVQIEDMFADPEYAQKTAAERGGFRSGMGVPMVREGKVIGAIVVVRTEPGRFSEKQVGLLQTFADQAVIAIENVRLFNETKEALEHQKASTGILRVVSSSIEDTAPVFEAIAESCAQIFQSEQIGINLLGDDGAIHLKAYRGRNRDEYVEWMRKGPTRKGGTVVRLRRAVAHYPDVQDGADVPEEIRQGCRITGSRAIIFAPMILAGRGIGAVFVARDRVGPFSEKEIALLTTFCEQAVIAIQNVRLFNETKEALERQTATAEILKVIASSPSDVQPVFDSIVTSARRLVSGHSATVTRLRDGMLQLAAHTATDADGEKALQGFYPRPLAGSAAEEIFRTKLPWIVEDTETDKSAPDGRELALRELARARGYRSMLVVPMTLGDTAIGTIIVTRREPGSFALHQIELIKTFADQAVIAIENVRLFNETKEALERQTATSEILRVISSSPTDLQPVFDAILARAVALCGARLGNLFRFDGAMLEMVASNMPDSVLDVLRRDYPAAPSWDKVSGRVVLNKQVVEIPDTHDDSEYRSMGARTGGFRAFLGVPMLREGQPIGAIVIARPEPGNFTQKQVAMIQTFADQAVIAIENVRLFKELETRNRDLSEALEQQTATAEILRVISSSPTTLDPVLEAVVKTAARLCDATNASLYRVEGDVMRKIAGHGSVPTAIEVGDTRPVTRGTVSGRAMLERRTLHIPDLLAEADTQDPVSRDYVRREDIRTFVATPLLREGVPIGAITVYRTEVRLFSDRQIGLLQTFADQAVIAIENVRLFNETKEALERQTATAEILKVISSSPTDVQPVFDAILENATRLCDAPLGLLGLYDGARYQTVAQRGANAEFADWVIGRGAFEPTPGGGLIGMIAGRRPIHIADYRDAPHYREGKPTTLKWVELGGIRTYLAVPMLKDERVVGGITIYRQEVRPFTQKQIDLISTFASQAAIAIENVRLFKELQARTEALTRSVGQLTALGEVGQAISSTLDLETVLKTIVSHALQLTGLDSGSMYEYDERAEEYHLRASENLSTEIVEALRRAPIRRNEGPVWRAGVTGQPTEIPEMLDESYQTPRREFLVRAGYRALLVVPLLREDHIIGALSVIRRSPGAFAPEVVELLKTFATQSALAIQNARLFREIAEKGRQLEVASRHKSDFLASMSHELRTPLNAILGFNEMILGEVYGAVPNDMKEPLADIQTSGKHLLRLINNVLDLAKIEAGRMELALSDYSVQDTVEAVRSTLRPLAADKGLEFLATVPQDIPLAHGDPGRITQCLMNLAGNSLKFTKAGRVEISVEQKDGQLTYRVSDTGMGIPPDKIGSLFTEFKQTDATIASEYGGTGLGLSISKKFIEMHGGRIWVESELGKGSSFIFEIPLRAGEGAQG